MSMWNPLKRCKRTKQSQIDGEHECDGDDDNGQSSLVRCKRAKATENPAEETYSCDDDNYKNEYLKLPPFHFSELILSKLAPFSEDYFRFGGVCQQWFSVLMEDRKQWRFKAQQHLLPLLLLVPSAKHGDGNMDKQMVVCRLYSVAQRNFLNKINLRVTHDEDIVNFCGSSYGWLGLLLKSYELLLYNPFGPSHQQSIRLPPIMRKFEQQPSPHDLPDHTFWRDSNYLHSNLGMQYGVTKFVLSADPRTSDNYIVVAIYSGLRGLAFFKPSNETSASISPGGRVGSVKFPSWTYLEDDGSRSYGFIDVVFHQGLIYAFDSVYGYVYVINLDDLLQSGKGSPVSVITASAKIRAPLIEDDYINCLWYITESTTKQLLLIFRLVHLKYDESHATKLFCVFKLSKPHGKVELSQWVEVKSLDGDAVFIGANHSLSVAASDSTGCQPNSLYFTDDFPYTSYGLGPCGSFGPRDMGIFRLEDASLSKHYTPDLAHRNLPPPIWILPMF